MAVYKGEMTREISMPIGGIGSGSIGLKGNGSFYDLEMANRPNKGSFNKTHIAIRARKNDRIVSAKILNGDLYGGFTGEYNKGSFSGFGFGTDSARMAGFPHFEKCKFSAEYPLAKLDFESRDFPALMTLHAFNPLIPNDVKNSSIPAAFFEVEIYNNTDGKIEYDVFFTVESLLHSAKSTTICQDGFQGLHFSDPSEQNDMTIITDAEDVSVQESWYRGIWRDGVTTYWNELSTCLKIPQRSYLDSVPNETGTVMCTVSLNAKQRKCVRFVLSWSFVYTYNYWTEGAKQDKWKNYYATLYQNSLQSAVYAMHSFSRLYQKTKDFTDSFTKSTLKPFVKDAILSNLAVLKSPTILLLEDGTLYGFEGVHELLGSCEGTCQHVYNYQYALAFLFPQLQKSIRKNEFQYSMNDSGRIKFRLGLPFGSDHTADFACVDGQMGAVIDCYREWKLSGEHQWLKSNWENIKKALDYAFHPDNAHKWDFEKSGVITGRQHHTLDMELFSPSSWLQGMYVAALEAAKRMAKFLQDDDAYRLYSDLYKSGKRYLDKELFNGNYYFQKIDLYDKSLVERFDAQGNYFDYESKQLKYQIGEGCAIVQLLAQWHADIVGLGDIFDPIQRKKALKNLYENNYKSMREHTNCWRIYALNDEKGAIICSYPLNSKRPSIPVPYCDETMYGFEYQLAGLLLSQGFIEEGYEIVKSIRNRHNGKNRNPFNEIECGSNYVRSLASFALLPIIQGFVFDLPSKSIGFNPIQKGAFRSPFFTADAYGKISIQNNRFQLTLLGGNILLQELILPFTKKVNQLKIDGKICAFEYRDEGKITFEPRTINKTIVVDF